MNDFTIEELVDLHGYIDDACAKFEEPDSSYFLMDKIKAMIDNYCEHTYFATIKPVCTICNKEI